jgi:chromosome segregation ATPase
MTRKPFFAAFAVFALAVSGCATTGRNYQTDIDSLNARITSLQAQIAEKDSEIAKLQNQMKEEEFARQQAESERRELNDRLSAAMSELESSKRAKASSRPDSDLK